jgi:anti-sigma B factor antagonist
MAIDFAVWEEPVEGDAHVVAVRGEIDLFTAPEFKEGIAAAIDSGRSVVVVDLSAATFIDSSSLGILISANKRLQLHDARLVIATDVPAILNTFSITGLDGVLRVERTRELALELETADRT